MKNVPKVTAETYHTFESAARIEADGVVQGVNAREVVILPYEDRKEVGERTVVSRRATFAMAGSDKQYELTSRALSNIFNLTGVTNRLFKELPLKELTPALNSQIKGVRTLGYSKHENRILTVFDNSRHAYQSYLNIVPDMGQLVTLRGNPLTDNSISFLTGDGVIEGDSLVYGVNLHVSSNSMVKNRAGYGFYRVRCANGAMDTVFGNRSFDCADSAVVMGMLNAFRNPGRQGAFVSRLTAFKNKLAEKSIPKDVNKLAELSDQLSAPQRMKASALSVIGAPADNELLRSSGVDKLDNLWELFNVMLYLANHAPNTRSAISLERGVFVWADRICSLS